MGLPAGLGPRSQPGSLAPFDNYVLGNSRHLVHQQSGMWLRRSWRLREVVRHGPCGRGWRMHSAPWQDMRRGQRGHSLGPWTGDLPRPASTRATHSAVLTPARSSWHSGALVSESAPNWMSFIKMGRLKPVEKRGTGETI